MGQETNCTRTPYQERNLGTHLFALLALPLHVCAHFFLFLYVFFRARGIVPRFILFLTFQVVN